jgi:hypothetical protein
MDTRTINDVHTNYCIILTNSSVTGHTSNQIKKIKKKTGLILT